MRNGTFKRLSMAESPPWHCLHRAQSFSGGGWEAGVRAGHCGVLSSIPVPDLLNARRTPICVTTTDVPRHCQDPCKLMRLGRHSPGAQIWGGGANALVIKMKGIKAIL